MLCLSGIACRHFVCNIFTSSTLARSPVVFVQILLEPYYDKTAVTDELVDVLLTPLLAEGVPEILFDQLSYSAGPLPEQLLQDPRLSVPVWVCWGEKDPWTPAKRVSSEQTVFCFELKFYVMCSLGFLFKFGRYSNEMSKLTKFPSADSLLSCHSYRVLYRNGVESASCDSHRKKSPA